MQVKPEILCPYCRANSSINYAVFATVQKDKAQMATNTRYGCPNKHYFAVPTETVKV